MEKLRECGCNAVLCGFGCEYAGLDVVIENVVLVLDAEESLDRQAHLLGEQSASQIAQVGTRY